MTRLLNILLLVWLLGAQPGYAQTVEYIHTDGLGSPVVVTDSNGNVIERSEFEPYGALLNRAADDRPAYTGHVLDAATGLNYMQQRYYDSEIGRFLSVDPVTAYSSGDYRFFNRYVYGFNNPYAFKDPDGRYTCKGSESDCKKVDQYVSRVKEAARSKSLTPTERAKVRAVSSYLGTKGKGGPTITPTTLPKNTKANTDQRGNIKIDVNKNAPGTDAVAHGAMALGHEAQHDMDAKAGGEAHTREVATGREKNAYGTEALIGKANGIMISPAAIDAAVKGSIENAFGPEPEKQNETP